MRRSPLFIVFFLSFAMTSFAQDWQELKGDHFLAYFTRDEVFAREVLNKAEVYYQRISSDLGYPRYTEFWTWDKRVKIYIHPDRDSFSKATNEPGWSEGMADYKNKQIISYAWSKGFTDSLLPHEIAHLIFRDFVGFKGEVPLWLDEGVAQWEENANRERIKSMAKELYRKDLLLSLEDMMRLDIRRYVSTDKIYIRSTLSKDKEKVALIISGDTLINTYYLQSVSLVGFLIERYGTYSFAGFCRQLRDGGKLEEALNQAYPDIHSLKEFENRWRKYLENG